MIFSIKNILLQNFTVPTPKKLNLIIIMVLLASVSFNTTWAATSLRDLVAGSRTVKLENNVKLYDGWTELMYAAWRGNLRAVTEILNKSKECPYLV